MSMYGIIPLMLKKKKKAGPCICLEKFWKATQEKKAGI